MSKLIILCESYLQIKYILRLLQLHPDDEKNLIILGFPDLFQFFKLLNEKCFLNSLNVVYLEKFESNRAKIHGINKLMHILPDIFRERHYLKNIYTGYFSGNNNAGIYFFTQGFSGLKMYLLNKLKNKNKLIFIPPEPPFLSQTRPENLTELISLLIQKSIYGNFVALGKLTYYRGFLYLPDKFMEKYVQIISNEDKLEMMKDFNLKDYRIFDEADRYSAVYYDDGLIDVGFVAEDSFKKEIKEVFDILLKHIPEKEVAVKYHPGFSGAPLPVPGTILPQYIPAELLRNENIQITLGVLSWAVANVEKGLTVSLADIISFKDDKVKRQMKDAFIKAGKTKVLFPQSLQNLDQIFEDITRTNA
jgi:hypothetical protein